MGIVIKSAREIEHHAPGRSHCGRQTLAVLADAVRPGITTRELDDLTYRTLTKQGAIPVIQGLSWLSGLAVCVYQ